MSKIFKCFVFCSLAFLVACGGGGKKVSRIDASSTTDLSGKWNDTDSRLRGRLQLHALRCERAYGS